MTQPSNQPSKHASNQPITPRAAPLNALAAELTRPRATALLRWRLLAGLLVALFFCAEGVVLLARGMPGPKPWLITVFFGAAVVLLGYRLWRPMGLVSHRQRGACDRVEASPQGITLTPVEGASRSLAWDDLTEVALLSTDAGPYVQDLFWCLESAGQSPLICPQDADGASALLDLMQQTLPGFDSMAVIVAMGSTEWARFVVWQRKPA